MIVLTATYTVRSGEMTNVLQALAEMTRLVKEKEPGCVMYRAHRSVDQPDRVLLYEVYTDQASFDAHSSSPYFQDIVLGRIVPKLLSRERSVWATMGD